MSAKRSARPDPEDPGTEEQRPEAADSELESPPAAEPSADGVESVPDAAPETELSPLELRLAALEAEQDRLLRLLAESENQLRRTHREREREAARLRGELVERLLPVVDDFERALEQLPENEDAPHAAGLRLIAQSLQELLGSFGLEPIPALGERFDPRWHEALIQLPNTDAEKGVVVQELQRGYRLGEVVIRPSKVAVAG